MSKISANSIPPFRASHVGSLLRPPALKAARAQQEHGEITADQLRAAEDAAIRGVIQKQQEIGLRGVTDGEFRRTFWHFDFLEALQGVEAYEAPQGIQFQGGQSKPRGLKVTGKLGCSDHPMVQHFAFVKNNTSATPKISIPSPSVLHYRGGRKLIDPQVYPSMDEFFHDLGQTYQQAIRAFADAGCKHLQLDEVNFTYLCDQDQRHMLRARGDDPDTLLKIYADLINTAVAARPADMRISMHLCRGNFRSMWIAQGGYEPVAETLFNLNVDGYFMEYDTERAGGFEPLRLVPKNKTIVLGLVTSKTGELESTDYLRGRVDEAARHIDLDQLCLSPQCGFASTEEGNMLTEAEQWAKLARVVETAQLIWN